MFTEKPYSRVYAAVNLDHIEDNMKAICAVSGGKQKIIGVVKADGYGHGSVPVAKTIDPYVCGFAVATVDEGIQLRRHGIEMCIRDRMRDRLMQAETAKEKPAASPLNKKM